MDYMFRQVQQFRCCELIEMFVRSKIKHTTGVEVFKECEPDLFREC
jgi:hypothetical protein